MAPNTSINNRLSFSVRFQSRFLSSLVALLFHFGFIVDAPFDHLSQHVTFLICSTSVEPSINPQKEGFVIKYGNNKVKFSAKKSYILFVGNLNYLPNILAVKDFAKNTLPSLIKKNSNIKFCIIGDIKNLDNEFKK